MNPLEKTRSKQKIKTLKLFEDVKEVTFKKKSKTTSVANTDELKKQFPHTFGRPLVSAEKEGSENKALKVGVVFSGGQASGGHNVIAGLFDALQTLHSSSTLIGFLGGPSGIVDHQTKEITSEQLQNYRNMGGFDLIGSGRTKIETDEQLQKSLETCKKLKLDGLVIIGGDDSNTNAAVLAEYFIEKNLHTSVVGVPKTIDGDLKNEHIEISFGFDTACKTYSEMIGNIARDALSAKKYYHFVKLMGRSASHIALECALKTHPNLTLISEEVAEKKESLKSITMRLADLVETRARDKKNFGIVLIPEGLIEFIPEIKTLIQELNHLLAENEENVEEKLSGEAKEAYQLLPESIKEQLLLDRDPHGNVQVSKIETEELLIQTVKEELKKRDPKLKFNAIGHFFGYEGRSCMPSNFDATYCYALGMGAALLIRDSMTGYMVAIENIHADVSEWKANGLPITMLMNIEVRHGKEKPVIRKALVDLKGKAFQKLEQNRKKWMMDDDYQFPGPIQFFGDPEITDSLPLSLLQD